jgi:hypothetical protein
VSEIQDRRKAIIDKTYAVQDGMVPVYDPEDEVVKAVPKNKTRHFLRMGYHVGLDAQNEALKTSGAAKVGSFLTAGGNAGSAGLLNLGLAATGNKGILKSDAMFQEANPTATLAGTVTGIVGSAVAGPLRLGGVGARALEAGAARGGLANLVAKGADVALQGAPGAAMMGASDYVTENTLLDHPMTAEGLAASAFSDMAWNAGFNALTHGVVRLPGAIRSGSGNLLDHLEHWGVLKKRMVPVEGAEGVRSRVASSTTIHERSYPSDGPAPGMSTDRQIGFDAGPDGEPGFNFEEEPSIEHRPTPEPGEAMPAAHGADVPDTAHGATAQVLDRAGEEVHLQAGLPEEAKVTLNEAPSVAQGRVAIEPELEAVPHVDNLSMKRQKLKAAELAEHAERMKGIKPEDIDPEFIWGPGYSQAQKLEQIRAWTKEGAAQAHPDALPMYDVIQNLEDEAAEILKQHAFDVKKGGRGVPNVRKIVQAKWAEKAAWKEELKKLYPQTWDAENGVWKPGYEQLNEEYRKIARPEKEIKGRPDYMDPKIKEWEADQAAHGELKAKADKAEAAIKFIEDHHKELEAQDAVIERNRIKTADAKAANKAAEREAKLAEKQISDAKKAAERKAIKAEADAARAQARAEAAAEREAKAAARKAEREAARADAEKLRAHEKRIDAQVKAKGKKLKFPRANGEAPKSSKTTSGTHVTEGPDGKRTETHTRTERNGQVKERIKVQVHAPKEPKAMRFDGYEKPFSGDMISKLALGGSLTGVGHYTSPIAMGMTAANLAVHIASHRAAIGKAFMRVSNGINKLTVPALAVGARTYRDRQKNKYAPKHYSTKDYQAMAKTAAYLSANPSAIVAHNQEKYPNLAGERPELLNQVSQIQMKAIQALQTQMPKKPYDPSLIDTDFIPTRAQQVKLMRTWDMLANPQNALDLADPETIRDLVNIYPSLTKHNQEQLTQTIQDQGSKVSGVLARQGSIYLGANVRPQDDAAALKRMQETAGPEPMQQGGGPNGAKPGASSKITNQAAQRDMPTNGLHQLGE